MRKEVDLCDSCEDSIGKGKCTACGNDVCNSCAYLIGISCFTDSNYNTVLRMVKYTVKSGNPKKQSLICKNCFKHSFNRNILNNNPKPLIKEIIKTAKNHAVALRV